jgi:hypothetical protein
LPAYYEQKKQDHKVHVTVDVGDTSPNESAYQVLAPQMAYTKLFRLAIGHLNTAAQHLTTAPPLNWSPQQHSISPHSTFFATGPLNTGAQHLTTQHLFCNWSPQHSSTASHHTAPFSQLVTSAVQQTKCRDKHPA